jgi:alpha-glucosidase (family GH31 glycosyl hydrolase)
MRLRVVALAVLAACGDNATLPATISSGPVSIDTATMTMTIASMPAMTSGPFLAVADAESIDEHHYYDPLAPDSLHAIDHAVGLSGGWLGLADGSKIRLGTCPIDNCAELDVDVTGHPHAVNMQLALAKDPAEPLYGTGDAATTANVAGTVREMQLRVSLTSDSGLNETHVPVPLVMWPRRGLAMFVADDRPGALDLGKSAPDRVTAAYAAPERGIYKIYLYVAKSPLDLVRGYVALSAKPAVPPRWAFAPQQWRNTWDSATEVLGDADAMRTRHIPGSVMWIDNPWETGYNTFVVDETRLPQPQQLIADLASRGYRVVFWSTPYVNTTGATLADHAEGAQNGYFVTDDTGVAIDYPWSDGPGALVDLTQDAATSWWRDRIQRVVSIGASGFKLDYGEDLVPDLAGNIVPMKTSAGDNVELHNRFSAAYHEAYLGALTAGDAFLITRAGAWGEQATNTAIWPGDLEGDFSTHDDKHVGGLPSAISRGLSLSVSGYPFYGSDIGGFRGFPTTESLLRWAEYAALGTIMQLGGGGTSHDPWDTTLFDAGADATYKIYADLHMQLHPLLWTLAQIAGADGTPVNRPAGFMYDCACDDAMFLLGDDILVAPVITSGATTRDVVLPPDRWVDARTGAAIVGDGHTVVHAPAPLDVIPMWYRSGSIVAMFERAADTLLPATATGVVSYADPAFGGELRLVYTPGGAASATLHDGTQATGNADAMTITFGTEYTAATFDIDGRSIDAPPSMALAAPAAVALDGTDLPAVATLPELDACAAPGCWLFDGASKRLRIRVHAQGASMRQITVR